MIHDNRVKVVVIEGLRGGNIDEKVGESAYGGGRA
jgi:hypothetical protein